MLTDHSGREMIYYGEIALEDSRQDLWRCGPNDGYSAATISSARARQPVRSR